MKEIVRIEKTEQIYEYRNFYFADVSKILNNDVLVGFKFEDKCAKKVWYMIHFEGNENNILLPEGCYFGEDCIYCHSMEQVEQVIKNIYHERN